MPSPPEPAAEQLRRALQDPLALIDDERAARAAFVLRSHAIEAMDAALADSSARALLVKGAALALTAYPKPWQREMCDVDLLVLPESRKALLAALGRAGAAPLPTPVGRPWSAGARGERQLRFDLGPADVLVEVHLGLDKVVARPVPYRRILRRAEPVPGCRHLALPSLEDHLLLVVLHAATSGFDHPRALVDLELLLKRGPDLGRIERRARAWKLGTALYVALRALGSLGSQHVPTELLARLEPAPLRRRALARYYDVDRFPTARRSETRGLSWIAGQGPLRDDLGRFALGVGAYGAVRALERSTRSLARWVARLGGPQYTE